MTSPTSADRTDELDQVAPKETYDGSARLARPADGVGSIEAEANLRGVFQPIDGKFHWYGRIAASPVVDEHFSSGQNVTISTAHGEAEGKLSDIDPWGRFRITGVGTPPF